MNSNIYLTPADLVERWRDEVAITTLEQWRTKNKGPVYTKVGQKVLYKLADVIEFEDQGRQDHS